MWIYFFSGNLDAFTGNLDAFTGIADAFTGIADAHVRIHSSSEKKNLFLAESKVLNWDCGRPRPYPFIFGEEESLPC